MDSSNKQWDYQFYPTPGELARLLVEFADITGEDVVLEPSAGRGDLLRAIAEARPSEIECCELMPENRARLEEDGWELVGADFLKLRRYARYSRIVANPPFTNDQDLRHLKHMYELLKFGGRLVCVTSAHHRRSAVLEHVEFRQWLDARGARVYELGKGAFDEIGVDVETVIITIDK